MIRNAAVIFACLFLTGCHEAQKTPVGGAARLPESTEIKLTIDTGDPKVTTVKVPYAGEKMTIRDLLQAAQPQGITAVYQGEGEGAMLQSLQGVGNEGGGKDAKNWIFYVNGKQATVSSAVYSLQPGDAIIWRFEKYE
jgi:Domain of unknown function (DUF4430)